LVWCLDTVVATNNCI